MTLLLYPGAVVSSPKLNMSVLGKVGPFAMGKVGPFVMGKVGPFVMGKVGPRGVICPGGMGQHIPYKAYAVIMH